MPPNKKTIGEILFVNYKLNHVLLKKIIKIINLLLKLKKKLVINGEIARKNTQLLIS